MGRVFPAKSFAFGPLEGRQTDELWVGLGLSGRVFNRFASEELERSAEVFAKGSNTGPKHFYR